MGVIDRIRVGSAPANSVARSAAARLLSFAPTAVATLLTSRLIISRFGIDSFDAFMLILTLINLIPLNNLGVGAAVTSAYAAGGPGSDHARRVTLTAARALAVSSAGTAAVALLLSAAGAWPGLLGAASGPNLYCGIAVAVYALSFLPGLGTSMLLGLHRNHVTVLVQTFFTPTILLGTCAVLVLRVDGDAVMIVPPAALVVNNAVGAWLAGRAAGVSWTRLLRALPRRSRHPGGSIRAMSGPMLVITLGTPIALQSDRIILSHVSSAQAVANYSVAFQMIAPAIALVAASAQPLWPIYTEARAHGRAGPSLGTVLGLFGAGGCAFGLVLLAAAGPVGHLIGGARIQVGLPLAAAAGGLVLVTALSYPVAMSLMDPQGIRAVCLLTVIGVPANVALSTWLAVRLGAPGPLLGSCLVGLGIQSLPPIVYAYRRRPPGRHRSRAAAGLADSLQRATTPTPG